jgi:phosphoribosylamine---glycine ligase
MTQLDFLNCRLILKMRMKILVIGSGGREHAIGHALAQSPACEALFFGPGNAGTATIGSNLRIDPFDFSAVATAVANHSIDLVVIGPEAPLEAGLADHLRSLAIPTVGPGKAGAIMEASKDWSKAFMARHKIPTAAYRSFGATQMEEAAAYVRAHSLPVVVKASGLAAGKGVLICDNHAEAEAGVREMLSGSAFGAAGETVVIEQFLTGIEVSVFVLTDGKTWRLLPEAKDYKRIGEGDTGLNTGGMGAVSPVPFADPAFMEKVKSRIVLPTVEGLSTEEIDYNGFIFIGLISIEGEPFVIEYNARMGDPETEVVFPRIANDVAELMWATANGNLATQEIRVREDAAATVFLVSGGYPGNYEKGKAISGLENVSGSLVFHAGTKPSEGQVLTDGGRVLAITSFGANIQEAVATSLENAARIDFEGKYYRRDIGWEFF